MYLTTKIILHLCFINSLSLLSYFLLEFVTLPLLQFLFFFLIYSFFSKYANHFLLLWSEGLLVHGWSDWTLQKCALPELSWFIGIDQKGWEKRENSGKWRSFGIWLLRLFVAMLHQFIVIIVLFSSWICNPLLQLLFLFFFSNLLFSLLFILNMRVISFYYEVSGLLVVGEMIHLAEICVLPTPLIHSIW